MSEPTDRGPRPKGLSCPKCRGELLVKNTRAPAAGVKVRYLRCAACNTPLKSAERLVTTDDTGDEKEQCH